MLTHFKQEQNSGQTVQQRAPLVLQRNGVKKYINLCAFTASSNHQLSHSFPLNCQQQNLPCCFHTQPLGDRTPRPCSSCQWATMEDGWKPKWRDPLWERAGSPPSWRSGRLFDHTHPLALHRSTKLEGRDGKSEELQSFHQEDLHPSLTSIQLTWCFKQTFTV